MKIIAQIAFIVVKKLETIKIFQQLEEKNQFCSNH